MIARVQLHLDRVAISRLHRLGYLTVEDRDPTSIHAAVMAALADRLSPLPAALADDGRR